MDHRIEVSSEETLQYLDDLNTIVVDTEEEEIIDYDLNDQLRDIPTQTLMSQTKTYTYTPHGLQLIATAHKRQLTSDPERIVRILSLLNSSNGVCEEKPNLGLDFMCPCKVFRETGICEQRIFL